MRGAGRGRAVAARCRRGTERAATATCLALLSAALVTIVTASTPARAGPVLDRVAGAGTVRCGVLSEPEDWGKDDVHAALPALGRDFCRAVAAAVLGSPDKVRFLPLPSEAMGFRALGAGQADVLMGATPSTVAGVAFGVAFARPLFYDGHALLVHRDSGIASFADLSGRLVCFVPGTAAQDVLAAEAERRHVGLKPWPFEENGELLAAVAGRKCDALFGSASRLALARAAFHGRASDFVLLPERYSVVPLSPAVPGGDAAWTEIVDAVAGAPIAAEGAGIDRAHTTGLRDARDPLLRGLGSPLPGIEPGTVDAGWGARALDVLGNYGELFERDLGAGSALDLPRGVNALWNKGGLMVPELPSR